MLNDTSDLHELAAARQLIQKRLLTLEASGHDGFEGFVRDALCEFTGIPMRLAKSGPQGGLDSSSNSVGPALALGMEAKRYKPSSSLKLDDLKAKLGDAADREADPIDLWVLVTSRELSANDVPALKRKGEKLGVGVVVLEWREQGSSLSNLQLLLTQVPKTIASHLPGDEVEDAVRTLASYSGESQLDGLRSELLAPNLGFAAAVAFMAKRLTSALSKRENAKAKLGSPIDILSKEARWASRAQVLDQLESWKSEAQRVPIALVRGEEGSGKTAVVLNWIHREQKSSSPPLVIFVPARDLTANNLSDALAAGLHRWTERFDEAYWKRRLAQWRKFGRDGDAGPKIFLVLDGLNEGNHQQAIPHLFSDVVSDDWRGLVGIIGTDRTGHWNRRFRDRFDACSHVTEIEIGQFALGELDDLLNSFDKQRSDFPQELIEIIKWPSWFGVAASMFDQGVDWKIYTREQLMVEYWTRRSSSLDRIGSPQAEQFREFVAGLGRYALANSVSSPLSKAELAKMLSDLTGEREHTIDAVVQDIVDGLWMTAVGPNKITVSDQLLPFTIALALLDELGDTKTFEEADARCEEALGPFEDRDIGVAILKAAAVLSASIIQTSSHVRSVIFLRWATQHNFSGWHFEIFWRSARHNIGIVLESAERCWLSQRGGVGSDEILVKAIANLADESADDFGAFRAFVERWFGKYWLDPHEGLYLGEPKLGSEERAADTKARADTVLQAYREAIGDSSHVEAYANGRDAGWLNHRLFAVISYLPRVPFMGALENWVISRAILDESHGLKDLAWVLRINEQDAHNARTAIQALAQRLSAVKNEHLQDAARWMLLAEGSLESAKLAERLYSKSQTTDTFAQLAYRIEGSEIIVPEDFYTYERTNFAALAGLAHDPSLRISERALSHALKSAEQIDPKHLGIGRSSTSEDTDYNQALLIAARWRPKAIPGLADIFLRSLPARDKDEELWGYAYHLDRFLLFIDDDLNSMLETAASRRFESRSLANDGDTVFDQLMCGALFGREANAQIQCWECVGIPNQFNSEFQRFQKPLSKADLSAIESRLSTNNDTETLLAWLRVLVSAGPDSEFPQNWRVLSSLFSHKVAEVRHLAFKAALDTNNSWYGLQLLHTDWVYTKENEGLTPWYGSLLLAKAATKDTFTEISQRIEPKVSSTLWETMGFAAEFAQPFREFVDASVEFELADHASRSMGGWTFYHKVALAKLIEAEPDKHKDYIRRILEETRYLDMTLTEWPIREYFQYYGSNDPDFFAALWIIAKERLRDSFMSRTDLWLIPFEAASSAQVSEIRGLSIERCKSDEDLVRLARTINRNRLVGWALDWAHARIASAVDSSAIARAMTLVGFLKPTKGVADFWRSELVSEITVGWLHDVKTRCVAEHEKLVMLDHWLKQLEKSDTDERVFASWLLVESLADSHSMPIIFDAIDEQIRATVSKRHFSFLCIAYQKLAQKFKSKNFTRDNDLFFTRTGPRTAKPWAS